MANELFFCSTEISDSGLPVGCKILEYLKIDGDDSARRVAVIGFDHPISSYQSGQVRFVALAKGGKTIEMALAGVIVPIFLLPFDNRVALGNINLSLGIHPVQDWGMLCRSKSDAEMWQG